MLSGCGRLTAEDRVFLARHPERPHIDEIVDALFTDFFEQCGDRQCKEDAAILGGVALFHGQPVTVIGHRKGSTLEENLRCNFGMPGPEGYRKALRLMKQRKNLTVPSSPSSTRRAHTPARRLKSGDRARLSPET